MSRTRHPNSYPIQFHEISTAALTKPQVFPIRIPFQTHAHAMTFRTRFYEFRRSLRAFAKTESSDPSLAGLQQLLAGAESITSPRIDHNKPAVAVLQLQEQVPYYEDSLAFISNALKAHESLTTTAQALTAPEPSSLEYYNFTTNRGRSYCIPSGHITDPSINTLHGLQARVQLVEARLERASSFLATDLSNYRTDEVSQALEPIGFAGKSGLNASIPEPTGYTDPDLQD